MPDDDPDPLADLADDVADRGAANGDGDGDGDGDALEAAFAEMDVPELDPEEVWAELADHPAEGTDADAGGDGRRVQHKHVCHGCEYFSAPPGMGCTHPGTEIAEVVDVDHYEVVDCPVMVGDEFE